jgi:hypothetical protein
MFYLKSSMFARSDVHCPFDLYSGFRHVGCSRREGSCKVSYGIVPPTSKRAEGEGRNGSKRRIFMVSAYVPL